LCIDASRDTKSGALRNGAPFKDWVLPAAMERMRRKFAGADKGNRQTVDTITAVITDVLPAVEAICAEAIAHGVQSADVVLNILACQRDPGPFARILRGSLLRVNLQVLLLLLDISWRRTWRSID
jgi:hypothetical protein